MHSVMTPAMLGEHPTNAIASLLPSATPKTFLCVSVNEHINAVAHPSSWANKVVAACTIPTVRSDSVSVWATASSAGPRSLTSRCWSG